MCVIVVFVGIYDICIIEDVSYVIGVSYFGWLVGDCVYSDICVFSFYLVKIIIIVEGGLVIIKDFKLVLCMELYCLYGVICDFVLMDQVFEGGWYYQMVDFGYNYCMIEMQVVLGVI